MAWNGSLHPRAAAGTSAGGQFTAGGSRQKPQKQPPPPKGKPESLKAIAAKRAAGKPLTPAEKHLWHLNHVNVMKREAATAAAAAPKAKPKTAAKKAAPKMTSGQKTKAMQMARSGR